MHLPLLIVALAATASLLSWPMLSGSTTKADRFWSYVTAHAPPGTPGATRDSALKDARGTCDLQRPISNLELRDQRQFNKLVRAIFDDTSAKKEPEGLTFIAVTEATFRYVCPVTKHLPVHPSDDLIARFPLPHGVELARDPTLGRRDDDEPWLSSGDEDPAYRTATYLVPHDVKLRELDRFYASHLPPGQPWDGWAWCDDHDGGSEGKGTTYSWQQGDLRLLIDWSVVDDSLAGEPGTLQIRAWSFDSAHANSFNILTNSPGPFTKCAT